MTPSIAHSPRSKQAHYRQSLRSQSTRGTSQLRGSPTTAALLTFALAVLATSVVVAAAAPQGSVDHGLYVRDLNSDLLLSAAAAAIAQHSQMSEPVVTAWKQLEQQRVKRLTSLLQAAAPKAHVTNFPWSFLSHMWPKTANSDQSRSFNTALSYHKDTQRPTFAASDLQQLIQSIKPSILRSAFVKDDRTWSQILEHLSDRALSPSSDSDTVDTSDSSFTQATAARTVAAADQAADNDLLTAVAQASTVPQPTRHRRLQASAQVLANGSSSGSSTSGSKTTVAVTRSVPDGYVTDVTETFSGLDLGDSTVSSISGSDGGPTITASTGPVQWQGPPAVQGVVSQRAQIPYRIIGGQEAPLGRFKWACSLRATNDFHYCGCSLIAPSVVMTAAHCLNHPDNDVLSKPWVEIGRHFLNGDNTTDGNDYDRIKCVKNVVNDGWSFNTGLNDIALCFLEGSSRFTPIKLADDSNKLANGEQLTVMGWGALSEGATNAPQLMEVNVDVVSQDSCNTAYQNAIRDTQICAGLPEGGADACQGDSGGPLVVEGDTEAADVQVGIVSYGVGCGRPNTPGVYTDVRKYRKYIKDQLLANGVEYGPLTGKSKAVQAPKPATSTAPAAKPSAAQTKDPACYCTTDGTSGGVNVGLSGCKQHGLDQGDNSYYCYTKGGGDCADATASDAYPGAAWIDCDPKDKQSTSPDNSNNNTSGADPAVAATDGSTTSESDSVLGSGNLVAKALQAWQGWMFNAAAVPATKHQNSTARIRSAATP